MKEKEKFPTTHLRGEIIPSNSQTDLGHPFFNQLFQGMQQWLDPKRWEPFIKHIENQVQVHERNDAYYVTVQLPGVEHPKDIQIQFQNNHLHLKRIVQHEMKFNQDQGAVWKTSYEHFERTIPFQSPIHWDQREIQAQNGVWRIKLPK